MSEKESHHRKLYLVVRRIIIIVVFKACLHRCTRPLEIRSWEITLHRSAIPIILVKDSRHLRTVVVATDIQTHPRIHNCPLHQLRLITINHQLDSRHCSVTIRLRHILPVPQTTTTTIATPCMMRQVQATTAIL